jgi:hypothetical protein
VKLILLFGRPAAGKLTIARELAALTGGRLFHNHLTVNLALALYEFGSPGFVALRERIWMDVFRQALADRLPLVLFTFNPEDSVPQRFIDGLFAEVAAAGGEVIPVEVTASEAAIESRLGSESRRRDRKSLGVEAYRELREKGVFERPLIPRARLRLDSEQLTPAEAAAQIAALL